MNKVILVGRLTKDPEVKYSTGEKANAFTRFTVAVNRRFKNAEGGYDSDFPSVIAFGKTAEFVGKYFHKGDMIGVTGEIRTNNYTNKEGVKVYTTDVNADTVEFVGGKSNGGSGGGSNGGGSAKSNFVNVPDGDEEEMPWEI